MDFEKRYELWKKSRAEADVPDGFADRVMASIHGTRMQLGLEFLQKLGVAAAKSRILQTSAYPVAITFLLLRLVALLAFFIPR